MTRILVTGARGVIGRHAVRALAEQGLEVHAVSRSDGTFNDVPICWHQADLLEPGVPQILIADIQPTHLLHLAWVTEHGEFWNDLDNKLWFTVSQRLFDAFVQNGGERIVGCGTCAEYDWTNLGDGVCRENDTPLGPHTLYGQCKHALANDLLNRPDVSAAWGRVFLLYGEGESPKRLIPDVALNLIHGRDAKCSSGRQIRDFMHAQDIGEGFAALLMSNVTGAVNVASGEPHTIGQVATLLGGISGHPERICLGALEDRPDDPPKILAHVERLQGEVGFTPTIRLEDGLRATYEALARKQSS